MSFFVLKGNSGFAAGGCKHTASCYPSWKKSVLSSTDVLVIVAGREQPGCVGRTVDRNLKGGHGGWWKGTGSGRRAVTATLRHRKEEIRKRTRERSQQAREIRVHLARDEEKEVGEGGGERERGGRRRVGTDCKVTRRCYREPSG